MPSLNDIRSTFLTYFERNDHRVVPSSPLVPRNDPTLMFANSGMVQFKNCFTGVEKRDYVRATTAQKCVRAGGKHNDLDNVGYTARHHTFFEMLGNFSFGDYFKPEAIPFAYNLITGDFGIDKNRLYATVYHTDDEAFEIWKKVGIPESRIIRIATKRYFDEGTQEAWKAGKEAAECTAKLSTKILQLPPTEKMKRARRFHFKTPNLTEAYGFFTGVELENAHSAMADTLACIEVYFGVQAHNAKEVANG